MAKIYGINGVITGKLGAAVYAVRNGEQISRQYQPIVANPQSASQVAARAKLKLMSQLSAVMAPVIAIPRQGAVSSRNLFVKENYANAIYNNNQADIILTKVQLTRSAVALPGIVLTGAEGGVTVKLTSSAVSLDRVVYAIFLKEADNKLRLFASRVNSTGGSTGRYEETFEVAAGATVVAYAYGVRDNNENAHTVFGNLTVETAEQVAKIIVSRTLTETDITLTETRADSLTLSV